MAASVLQRKQYTFDVKNGWWAESCIKCESAISRSSVHVTAIVRENVFFVFFENLKNVTFYVFLNDL